MATDVLRSLELLAVRHRANLRVGILYGRPYASIKFPNRRTSIRAAANAGDPLVYVLDLLWERLRARNTEGTR